jgi:hypothetical protein
MRPRFELHIGKLRMKGNLQRLHTIIANTDQSYELYAYIPWNPGEQRLTDAELERALAMRLRGGRSYQTISRLFHCNTKWLTDTLKKMEEEYHETLNLNNT